MFVVISIFAYLICKRECYNFVQLYIYAHTYGFQERKSISSQILYFLYIEHIFLLIINKMGEPKKAFSAKKKDKLKM